jgi:iron complex outermembrane recepter protein
LLVQGQRFVSTDQYSRTDISVIPVALIKRTDVVAGGASAAWGSDAIAGVVNVVLKDKLEGFEGNIQYGSSFHNDNKQISGALAWGTSFAGDRGQFMIAGEYSHLTDPPRYSSRGWSSQRTGFTTQTIGGVVYTNVVTNDLSMLRISAGGVFSGTSTSLTSAPSALSAASPLFALTVGPNGTLIPYVSSQAPTVLPPGATTFTSAGFGYKGDGAWVANNIDMGENIKKYNIYTRATYELTDTIKASFQGSYAKSDINADQPPIYFPNGTARDTLVVPTTNAFLLALKGTVGVFADIPNGATGIAQYLAANPTLKSIALQRTAPEFGTYHTNVVTDVYRVSLQLDGKFRENGSWSAYVTKGQSTQNVKFTHNLSQANLHYALGGCTGSTAAGTAFANASAGCVPLNPFGVGSITAAAAAYADGTGTNRIVNGMTAGGVTLSDQPFSLFAGPVSLTVGAEGRIVTLSSITNSNILPSGVTGLPAGLTSPPPFDFGVPVTGSFDNANPKNIPYHSVKIWELFGEAAIPLIKDVTLIKSLDFNGAFRYANHEVTGGTTNWKLGDTWEPFDGILFRIVKTKDSRDPNLAELYQGANAAAGSIVTKAAASGNSAFDPNFPLLSSPGYSFPVLLQGSDKLKPETAFSLSYGVSLSPPQIPGLHFSVDIWDIDIRDQIAQPGAVTILQACFQQQTFINSPPGFCNFIGRDANSGLINVVYNQFANIARARVNGVDIALDYRTPLSAIFKNAPGTLSINAQATNTLGQYTQSNSVAPIVNCVGVALDTNCTALPAWRGTVNVNYQTGPFSFNLVEKIVGKLNVTGNNAASSTGVVPYYNNNIPTILYTNLQLAYNFKVRNLKKFQVYANINNLFDRDPPILPNGPPGTLTPAPALLTGSYDYVGRAFTAGVRFKF